MAWLDIPYEENEWVEDKMVDVLRMAVTTVAQDYVWTRMTGGTKLAQAMEETSKIHDQKSSSNAVTSQSNDRPTPGPTSDAWSPLLLLM